MIVGITGPICAGKGKAAEVFKELGFTHHSFSAEIRQIAKERGLEITRDSLSKLGGDLRKESPNHSILAERVLQQITRDMRHGKQNFVVDGLRDYDELFMFREREFENKDMRFILIGIDAPQELRYKRLRHRGREGDPKTFEEFKCIDDREIKGTGGQEVGKCMKMADYVFDNSGTIKELENKILEIIKEIS